jgi:glycosyltransferase involved in cell wall biosynthesis
LKILFIIPGSGDSFYCGNCFRDNLHASALRKAGHEVVIMPLYLPLRDKSFQADAPLFFPATTYYAAQKFFGKRKMPKWMERIIGSKAMLNLASSMSGATSAEGMEGMTLSMITGDDPAFAEHVERLISWIKSEELPDVIHLSSTLLIGVAKALRQRLSLPIVCSVQDEEVWIDSLKGAHAAAAWRSIAANAEHISHFVTTSEFYRRIVLEKIPAIKNVAVIYPGVSGEKYASASYPKNPVVGFFYRMNELNGLDILAKAFVELKRQNAIPNLQLKIGGGYTGKDRRFLRKVKKLLQPYRDDVELDDRYSLGNHAEFYRSISVICAPLRFEEGVGLYLCEAFAAGRPAVVPASGSFPEIVSRAGVLYHPNSSEALAAALQQLLTDKNLYAQSVKEAEALFSTRYNDKALAEKLVQLYAF